jgi:spermidine/putrescine transport system permease protein
VALVKNRPASIAAYLLQRIYLLLLFCFLATPMLIILVFSFDRNRFPSIPWGGFSLAWHQAIWTDSLVVDAFRNSVLIAIGSAIISTALGFVAAYVDYRYRFRGQGLFVGLIALPPAVPASILGMAMLAFLSRIGYSGRIDTIIACHVVVATSFSMAIIRLRLGEIGSELEQVAWNLGASRFRAIVSVVVPFCRQSLIASFFLAAAISFDEFMIGWFVGGVHETISVRILNLLQGQVNPKINAIGTVVLLVSVVLVVVAQRFTGLSTRPPGSYIR